LDSVESYSDVENYSQGGRDRRPTLKSAEMLNQDDGYSRDGSRSPRVPKETRWGKKRAGETLMQSINASASKNERSTSKKRHRNKHPVDAVTQTFVEEDRAPQVWDEIPVGQSVAPGGGATTTPPRNNAFPIARSTTLPNPGPRGADNRVAQSLLLLPRPNPADERPINAAPRKPSNEINYNSVETDIPIPPPLFQSARSHLTPRKSKTTSFRDPIEDQSIGGGSVSPKENRWAGRTPEKIRMNVFESLIPQISVDEVPGHLEESRVPHLEESLWPNLEESRVPQEPISINQRLDVPLAPALTKLIRNPSDLSRNTKPVSISMRSPRQEGPFQTNPSTHQTNPSTQELNEFSDPTGYRNEPTNKDGKLAPYTPENNVDSPAAPYKNLGVGTVLTSLGSFIANVVQHPDGHVIRNTVNLPNGDVVPNIIIDKDGIAMPNVISDKDGKVIVDIDGQVIPNIVMDKDGNVFPNIVTDSQGDPMKDNVGNILINVIRDKKGNPIIDSKGIPIPNILLDCYGNPILDGNGNVQPNILRDKDGNVIVDKNGQVIPNVSREADGKPLLDKNEKFIANVKFDKKNNPLLDILGNAIPKIIMNAEGNPFLDKRNNATDTDGNVLPAQPKQALPADLKVIVTESNYTLNAMDENAIVQWGPSGPNHNQKIVILDVDLLNECDQGLPEPEPFDQEILIDDSIPNIPGDKPGMNFNEEILIDDSLQMIPEDKPVQKLPQKPDDAWRDRLAMMMIGTKSSPAPEMPSQSQVVAENMTPTLPKGRPTVGTKESVIESN
jgi:hypothetical protein